MLGTIQISGSITSCFYLQIVLFSMHERDTATEKAFDSVLQMTLRAGPNSEIQKMY